MIVCFNSMKNYKLHNPVHAVENGTYNNFRQVEKSLHGADIHRKFTYIIFNIWFNNKEANKTIDIDSTSKWFARKD